ncbi:MAG: polymer-forming cytoskeletal protein [Saprospiraceae bacterium]
MFGRKKKTENNTTSTISKSSNSTNTSNSACVIVKGTVIEGEFYSKSDTRLDGIINGKVTCEARLIMGKDAIIDGIAQSKGANISGVFTGDLTVDGILSLGNAAKVEGNVKAAELEVEEGAFLNGDIAIGKYEKK